MHSANIVRRGFVPILVSAGMVSSFFGCGPSEELTQAKSRVMQLEQQVEELKSENTSLAQKNIKLDQDNKTLLARMADLEEKLIAERERAEKLMEATKPPAPTTLPTPKPTVLPAPTGSREAYEAALRTFNAKNYDAAIQQLEALMRGGVDPDLEDNCHYWLGEAYFGKRNYQEALRHFDMVMGFKGSDKMADAQFMIAQCYERTGEKAKAKQAYEAVVKDFPTSPHVTLAKERAGKL